MRILIFALLAVVALAYTPDYDDEEKLEDAMAIAPGYALEIHYVLTGDGSILSMCKIYKDDLIPVEIKKDVMVHPGVQSSSVDFVFLKEKSLVYMLADEGYAVWIPNPRGNVFSKFHLYYTPYDYKYWDYSFYEMGIIDLPSLIDYILEETEHEQIYYIGQGQGVTVFLVMATELPEYKDKIINAQALSPIVFTAHMRSPLKYLAYLFAYSSYKSYEFAGHDSPKINALRAFCKANDGNAEFCLQVFFFFAGSDRRQINSDQFNKILDIWPSGTSSQVYTHLSQLVVNEKFQYYQTYYGQKVKEFDLTQVTTPFCVYAATNDPISTVEDSKTLLSKLSNKKCQEVVVIGNNFNHPDFIWGQNANEYLYPQVIANMI